MRQNNNRKPKRVYSFVVDGETEVWYLQSIRKHAKLRDISIQPELPRHSNLADQYKLVIDLAVNSEKVFWIVDLDVIIRDKKQDKFKCLCHYCAKNKKITVVVNNPCLEFWFLLHFKNTGCYYSTYEALLSELVKQMPGYEKKEVYYKNPRLDIYQRLYKKLSTAMENSKRLGDFDVTETERAISEMHKVFSELGIE